jgi:hypothetical protein
MTYASGGCRCPYITRWDEHEPLDQTDFNVGWRCILGGGLGILQKLVEGSSRGAGRHAGGADRPHLAASRTPVCSHAFWCLLLSSSISFVTIKFCPFSQLGPPSYVFWINPAKNRDSPKLVKFVSLNPRPMYILVLEPFLLFIHI